MLYEKKATVVNFAKKGEDIHDQDIIQLANEGQQVPGNFDKVQNIFLAKMANGSEKNISVNQTSINNLVDAFGKDSKQWIGKDIKVWLNRENVSGRFVQVMYLTHPDQVLGESYQDVNAELDEIKE